MTHDRPHDLMIRAPAGHVRDSQAIIVYYWYRYDILGIDSNRIEKAVLSIHTANVRLETYKYRYRILQVSTSQARA